MCGICGFLGNSAEEPFAVVKGMAASIRHRGAEADGFFLERPVALGHQRLSILDLAARADQPFKSADGRFVLVFNGEIYNYRELQGMLAGFTPHTTSDTEILTELWARLGPDCLQYLNGMFAFAIFDRHEKSLFCVRDRLGVKPFYYWHDGSDFIFASEAKAVLRHPKITAVTDWKAVSDYLSLGYVTGSSTIFAGVKKLEPGCYLKVTPERINKICYWNLGQRIAEGHCRESDALLDLLDSAIEYRLISDVPVGSFLSAGIDSSAITAIAARKNRDIQTFTIGFREKSYDEAVEAARFAAKLGLPNQTDYFCEPDSDFLQLVVKYFDQPFADTSVMPFFQLCSLAARRMKVVLSGDGGDELFAGYETRRADAIALTGYRTVPFWNNLLRLGSGVMSLIPADRGKVSLHYKLRQFLEFAHLPPQQSHFCWRLLFTEDEKRRLLSPQIVAGLSGHQTWNTVSEMFAGVSHLPILQQQAVVDLQSWMADDILYKVDQAAMASTLEVRSPFLDYRLVESAFAIPEKRKFSLLKSKTLLRKKLAPVLPPEILKRKKEGFGSPVSMWLEGHLAEVFLDCMHAEAFREVFPDTAAIMKLYDDHRQRVKDNGYRLWALLMFAFWQKEWMRK
ncbi:MAG TPA: asparagine synthase (glutamine-hydrolyzing) [Candidatus Rifleibacterium sp.]|nr:asparagine synthase (glutamine-hydrolyzing) [Candidatus Rifleibacterium sp.]HPT44742.1 asparagine synthase (glutamine-hydrolyzing) [Candidatus Rifleibacterium sp.]